MFRKHLWHHKPLTDVWNIGNGIAKRLEKYGVHDLHGITEMPEEVLYKEFGTNAEYLIDHAHGVEPCTIADIHNYQSKSHSLSNSQILFEDYAYDDALIVMQDAAGLRRARNPDPALPSLRLVAPGQFRCRCSRGVALGQCLAPEFCRAHTYLLVALPTCSLRRQLGYSRHYYHPELESGQCEPRGECEE